MGARELRARGLPRPVDNDGDDDDDRFCRRGGRAARAVRGPRGSSRGARARGDAQRRRRRRHYQEDGAQVQGVEATEGVGGDAAAAALRAVVASASTPSVFSPEELAETVVQTVADARGQEDLVQAHLFGLVGVEGMELIAFVLQHASALTPATLQSALALASASASASASAGGRPAAGSAFSIQTATELLQQKQQRKAARRAARHRGDAHDDDDDANDSAWLEAAGYDLEVLRLQRQLDAEEQRNESTSLLLREFGALHGGFDTSGAAGQLTSAGMLTLPEATKRTHFKGYEHVFIPAHARSSSREASDSCRSRSSRRLRRRRSKG
ncbi:hypothetical protein PINS_up023782 [Pythium insidiosum]|nr:hypothetical protein PINS_up023782 [Pythium insidiosum]